jgi:hypothetical protein
MAAQDSSAENSPLVGRRPAEHHLTTPRNHWQSVSASAPPRLDTSSMGFSEQLARHLKVVKGMTGPPVGVPPKQLEDREIRSSLNQKQSLIFRHAGRQRVGSAVSGAHEIPREAFRQVSMCCITISGKCPMDRRISDCGMVCSRSQRTAELCSKPDAAPTSVEMSMSSWCASSIRDVLLVMAAIIVSFSRELFRSD